MNASLLGSFRMLNAADGGGGDPPDTIMAVGPDRVIGMVNTAIGIFDKSGTRLFSADLGSFFNDSGGFLSDPVVTYDELAQRFYVGILDFNANTFQFAVSADSSPSSKADFNEFHSIDLTDPGDSSAGADYPKVGWNAEGIFYTFNMFGSTVHPMILTIDKSTVLDGNAGTLTTFKVDRTVPGDFTFNPASQYGAVPGDPEWFIESPNRGGNTVTVTKMTNVLSNTPTMVDTVLDVPAFAPTNLPADPGGTFVSPGFIDTRILNAVERGGTLVASQDVGSGSVTHARIYDVDLTSGTPVFRQSAEADAGPSTYTFEPAVSIAPSGAFGLSYGESSPSENLSVYVTGRTPGDPLGTLEPGVLVQPGQAILSNFGRIGDYSGVGIDPIDGSFWAANEFADNSGSFPNWNTEVAHFDLPVATHFVVAAPAQVTAGALFSVTVTAEDANNNVAPYVGTIHFTTTDPQGVLPQDYAFKKAENGVHVFNGVILGTAGTQVISVNDTSVTTITGTSNDITVLPGAADHVFFLVPPTTTAAGTFFNPGVTVAVVDKFSNPIPTDNSTQITMTIGSNPGGSTLSGTTTLRVTNGSAIFGDLTLNKTGVGYTLHATPTGNLTDGISKLFNITPGAPDHVTFAVQPTTTVAGATLSPPVTVRVFDRFDNFVSNDNTDVVTMAIGNNPGNALLFGSTSRPAVNCVATFSNLSIQKAALGYTLVAGAGGLLTSTSTSFDIKPTAPTHIGFVQQPSTVGAGLSITPAVSAAVLDRFENVVYTDNIDNITLGIANNPAGGTLSGTTKARVVNGVATFFNLSIDKAGSGYSLAARNGNLTSAFSVGFTVTAGTPDHFTYVQQPTNVRAGVAINPGVTFQFFDIFDNLASNDNSDLVSIALGNNPGAATLGGTTTVSVQSGLATFPDLTLDKVGSGYTLVATSSTTPSAPAVTSNTFNVTPGLPFQLQYLVQPSDTGAGDAIKPPVQVSVLDRFGNLVTVDNTDVVTIALGANPGGSTLSGGVSATVVNGVASFNSLSLNKIGVGYTLTASGTSGVLGATSGTFTISAGSPAQLVFFQQPGNSTAGVPFAPPLQVLLFDRFNNLATNDSTDVVTLSLAANPGGGTLLGSTSGTANAGVVTFPNVAVDKAAVGYTLAAHLSNTVPNGISNPFNITPGPADHLLFGVQPSTTTAGVSIAPAITVSVMDLFNNVVTSDNSDVIQVQLGSNPGSATLSGNTSAQVSAGVATFSNLSLDKAAAGYTLLAPAVGNLTGALSSSFAITPAAASHFAVTAPNGSVALAPLSVTVIALDPFGNVDSNYRGTVHVTSSDPRAALPSDYAFVIGDAGIHAFNNAVILNTAGTQTVTVTDTTAGAVTGTSNNIAVTNPTPTVTRLSVNSAVEGAQPLTVVITGTNFVFNSSVLLGGTPVTATVNSSTQITATLSAVNLSEEGNLSVTVVNAGPGGGASTGLPFTIADAALSTTSTGTVTSGQGVTVTNIGLGTILDQGGPETVSLYRVSINWGDGTSLDTTSGTLSLLSGSSLVVSGSHTYPAPGRYAGLHVIVTDEGGASTNFTTNAVIGSANQRFVAQAYLDLLHRAVDTSGLSFWAGQLDKGAPTAQVVNALVASREFLAGEINGVYQSLLGRAADPAGMTAALQLLSATPLFAVGTNSLDLLRSALIGTQEYFNRNGGTIDGFLNALYRDIFGRAIDSTAKSSFTQQLNAGLSRTTLAKILLGSLEARRVEVDGFFTTYLHRTADTGGETFFANFLAHGGNEAAVVAALVSSQEYFNNV